MMNPDVHARSPIFRGLDLQSRLKSQARKSDKGPEKAIHLELVLKLCVAFFRFVTAAPFIIAAPVVWEEMETWTTSQVLSSCSPPDREFISCDLQIP